MKTLKGKFKCAAFIGGFGSENYRWCNKPATRATSGVRADYDGEVPYVLIGYTYCDEHAPSDADVIIP